MRNKLAFLGPTGTHSEQAAIIYAPDSTKIACASIPLVAAKVESGEAEEGILPIENSLEGSVNLTLDLLIHDSSLSISHEIVLPITHSIIAKKGTSFSNIKFIYSHPQALAQCRNFLSKNLPDAIEIASMSTASAVKEMLQKGENAAAIGTERAGSIYGALTIAHQIEDNPNNVTRFIILAPNDSDVTGEDKTSVCFSFDGDAPGILHSTLNEFAKRKINLTKIESRPSKKDLGRYIFLTDIEGHRKDKVIKEALTGIKKQVSMFKIFGSYPRYRHNT